MIETFKRHEKKYILSKDMYQRLEKLISPFMEKDDFSKNEPYLIRNIYLDTPNKDLIRMSCDKPIFKEKIRIRKYGTYNDNIDKFFLEVKRKYDGIVYKRRVCLNKEELHNFTVKGIIPNKSSPLEKQILKELSYTLSLYEPIPSSFISYKRIAYISKEDSTFRLTFDFDLYARHNDFSFDNPTPEIYLLEDGYVLMEVKVAFGVPLWFSRILSEVKAVPTSFSKYGTDYKLSIRKDINYHDTNSIWHNFKFNTWGKDLTYMYTSIFSIWFYISLNI